MCVPTYIYIHSYILTNVSILHVYVTVLHICMVFLVQSLCNACGIRQRKARRAMAEAAAAAANGFAVGTTDTTATTAASSSMKKEKKWRGNDHNVSVRCKNKRKVIMTDVSAGTASYKYYKRNNKHLCDFEQLASFPPSVLFPQDVAEAAILLMELSCGLINHS